MPIRARSRFRSWPGIEDVLAVEQDLALGALLGIEVVHAVEHAQQRGLAAARRADEGRRRLLVVERQVDVLQRLVGAVEELQVPDR